MNQTTFRFSPEEEMRKRDLALDLLEAFSADVIEIALQVAVDLDLKNGQVSGPDVFAEMNERGLSELLKKKDPRFMGAVFRRGWRKIGTANSGSHRRPVSVWTRRRAA